MVGIYTLSIYNISIIYVNYIIQYSSCGYNVTAFFFLLNLLNPSNNNRQLYTLIIKKIIILYMYSNGVLYPEMSPILVIFINKNRMGNLEIDTIFNENYVNYDTTWMGGKLLNTLWLAPIIHLLLV